MDARALLLPCLLAAGCGGTESTNLLPAPAVPRPTAGIAVEPGELIAALERAAPGAVLCLEPGVHPGPLTLDKPVTIWGPPQAVVRSQGSGTTIAVEAPGIRLLGFTVDGSGGRFDTTDAAVRVRADGAEVRGLRIINALFGILVELAEHVQIVDNLVVGTGQKAMGLRGDGIRLWETRNSTVSGNRVYDARDVVVWYSSGNRITGNSISGCRYGTHFMYSHENLIAENNYQGNVVGVFVMYSRDVELRRNLIARCSGAAGIGLGVKESGNLTVVENAFLANTTSVYLDTSPLNLDHSNRFERNHFRMSDTAVSFHASPVRNEFIANTLRDNSSQVKVGGGGNALGSIWRGNFWDDYQGYDLDGDGIGDLPYEVRSLSGDLISKHKELAFLRGTPTLHMVDLVGQVLPLFAARQILVDRAPAMTPMALEWLDAR